jgi:hypothetical protein
MTSQGGHVHAITRDPTNDYGMDWLGLHYQVQVVTRFGHERALICA